MRTELLSFPPLRTPEQAAAPCTEPGWVLETEGTPPGHRGIPRPGLRSRHHSSGYTWPRHLGPTVVNVALHESPGQPVLLRLWALPEQCMKKPGQVWWPDDPQEAP